MTDYEMTQEIRDAISKHLPSAVGDELRKRLKQADEFEAEVARLRQDLANRTSALSNANEIVNRVGDLNVLENDLAKRNREVTLREAKAELLDYKVQAAHDKATAIHELVRTVFSNPTFIYSTLQSGQQVPDQYGNMQDETITRTTEATTRKQ